MLHEEQLVPENPLMQSQVPFDPQIPLFWQANEPPLRHPESKNTRT